MVGHLTQEWVDVYQELGGGLPVRPGASARLQHVVAKTPIGDVAYVVELTDGRVSGCRLGADDTVDVTVQQSHADSIALLRGELDLHVGFMQGRLKLIGDMGPFLAIQPVTQSEEHRTLMGELANRTEV